MFQFQYGAIKGSLPCGIDFVLALMFQFQYGAIKG